MNTRILLSFALLAACGGGKSSVGDGGAADGGVTPGVDSSFAGIKTGSSTVVPMGKPASGAFSLAWWSTIGSDSGHKAVPQIGYFNGDGVADLSLNPRLKAFYVYMGQGKGKFATPTKLNSGGFAGGWGGDVGDLDGDGDMDVAFGDHVAGVKVYLNDGAGSFKESSPSGLKGTYSGAGLGEVNGDRKLDLVLGADQFAAGVRLLLGDGKGGFTEATASGLPSFGKGGTFSNVGHFAMVDMDADGDQDLFAFGQAHKSGGGVICKVYANGGDGSSWTEVASLQGGSYPGVGTPVQGSVGDVNGDTFPDVSAGGTIYLSDKGTSFKQAAQVDSAHISHLGDMDGDGNPDLVTHEASQGLRLYLGDGTGKTWTEDSAARLPDAKTFPPGAPVESASSVNAYGIDLGDLDGNGKLDIVRVVVAKKNQGFIIKAGAYLEVWVR